MQIYQPRFSHIYLERGAEKYPPTARVLDKYKSSTVIQINDYKEVFNRKWQDFASQKRSQKLILAVKRGNYLLSLPEACDNSFTEPEGSNYYAAQIMNCAFDCEYCYLRGMYESANVVAFVNTGNFQKAVPRGRNIFLSVSYESDMLAFEEIFRFAESWIDFARAIPSVTLEIRTKSASINSILKLKPAPNVILSWSVSPDKIITEYEKNTPPLKSRLEAARSAAEAGWRVRLCADPILLIGDWQSGLISMFDTVRGAVDINKIEIITGGFRVSKVHFKRMRKLDPTSALFKMPLTERNGVMRYPQEIENEINSFVKGLTE